MRKKFLGIVLGLVVAVGFPTATVFASDTYTKVDIDTWDYDRTEALTNQISVQADVEYEPPEDLEKPTDATLSIDYSNQTVEEKPVEQEVVSESAVVETLETAPIESKKSISGMVVLDVFLLAVFIIVLVVERMNKK